MDLTTQRIHQPFVGVARPKKSESPFGYSWIYAQHVRPVLNGAVTYPGAAAETSTYADF